MSFEIRRTDLSALALGSGILGTGGGGNSYDGQLVAAEIITDKSAVRVIDVTEMKLPRVVRHQFRCNWSAAGSSEEASKSARPGARPGFGGLMLSRDASERSSRRRFRGLQCMFPRMLAAQTGIPLLDGDGIGRAFPEIQMCTFMIDGTTPGLPLALSGDSGLLLEARAQANESPSESIFARRAFRHRCRVVLSRKICSDDGGLNRDDHDLRLRGSRAHAHSRHHRSGSRIGAGSLKSARAARKESDCGNRRGRQRKKIHRRQDRIHALAALPRRRPSGKSLPSKVSMPTRVASPR